MQNHNPAIAKAEAQLTAFLHYVKWWKRREHQKDLYIAFIDFTKAFHCVNRELLFVILEKIGCPVKMTNIIKALYSNVKAKVIVDGELSEAFNYDGGV